MNRAKKFMKLATLILIANLLADNTVYQVVKELAMGDLSEQIDESAEMETAFMDSYGDFE